MRVAAEHQPRLGAGEAFGRSAGIADIAPFFRLMGACVDKEHVPARGRQRQAAQETQMIVSEFSGSPFNRAPRVRRHPRAALERSLIMIALHADCAVLSHLTNRFNSIGRIRTITDDIAQKDDLVSALAADRMKHRVQRLPVSVNVG